MNLVNFFLVELFGFVDLLFDFFNHKHILFLDLLMLHFLLSFQLNFSLC